MTLIEFENTAANNLLPNMYLKDIHTYIHICIFILIFIHFNPTPRMIDKVQLPSMHVNIEKKSYAFVVFLMEYRFYHLLYAIDEGIKYL